MHPDFWHQRWHDNRIGFHQAEVTQLLQAHWDAVAAPAGCTVFVPLAGKSLDMVWLASRGHRVLGVELSPLAVEQFFVEHGLAPEVFETRCGIHHRAGGIELICGDAFALDADALADCAAVFDRAAMIALPEDLRARYVDELYGHLPAHCRGLLVTLEYPVHEKEGPPFPVTATEVETRFSSQWSVTLLQRQDILADQPGFQAEGVTALEICAFRLVRTRA